jgi:multidrug efflux pump subunit AcrA (membrane-fusion protein)
LSSRGFKELSSLLAVAVLQGVLAFPINDESDERKSQATTASGEIDFSSDAGRLVFLGEVTAKPQLVAEVVAPMWGKIYLEEGVYEGAKVKKDQPLARIVFELDAVERLALEDRTLEIEQFLEKAREKARRALGDYRRAVEISKVYPEYKSKVDRRKQIYDNAVKELQMVDQQNRRQTSVIKSRDPRTVIVNSPFSGYIQGIHIVPGEINPLDEFRKLFTVVDLSTVWVQAEIHERDLATFKDPPDVLVSTLSDPGESFKGRFQALGSEINLTTRTLPVYYEISNPDEKLRIGLRVRVRPVKQDSP